jgi:hypothetical protein
LQFCELVSRLAAFGHFWPCHSGKIRNPMLKLA